MTLRCKYCKQFFKSRKSTTKFCTKFCYVISKFREPKKCYIEDCLNNSKCNGLCHKHETRKRFLGSPTAPRTRGIFGLGNITNKGYKKICIKGRVMFEHRYIMEQHIGRELVYPFDTVHHINQSRLDNRIENLQLISASEHAKLHNRERRKNE